MEDAIVVGAGTARLAASWRLRRRGVEHVVLERGRVGETWRTQRWDSFTLNTPTSMSRLPGGGPDLGPADAFVSRDAWVAHLDGYAQRYDLPVRAGAEVTSLVARPDGTFEVRLAGPGPESITARSVVVASGAQCAPRVPALAAGLPDGLPEDDPADRPHPAPESVHGPTTLDLERARVGTVIWATGVTGRFDWLPPRLLDERGALRHEDGCTPIPGLYVLGLPWLRSRGSGIVYGMDRDAAAIVNRVTERLAA